MGGVGCPFGRQYDAGHRTCRSCVKLNAAACQGLLKARLPKRAPKDWRAALLQQIHLVGLPEPTLELAFHPERKWRWDLSWGAPFMVAVEVQGAVHQQGRHTRGRGYENDVEKRQAAEELGWRVLWVTPKHIKSGEALGWIESALKGKP